MGGIAQGIATKRSNDATKSANDALTSRMEQSRRAYAAYRPQVAEGRQKALSNTVGLFDPANEMLGEMTGGKYKMDFEPIKNESPLVMRSAPNAYNSGESTQLGGGQHAASTAGDIAQAGGDGYDTSRLEARYLEQGGDAQARKDRELWDAKNEETRARNNAIANSPLGMAMRGKK